jgi:hypothetical protein
MDASPTLALSRDLGQRAVRLITHLHAPDDLSPAGVERHFGLPVAHHPQDARRFGCGRALDARWICNLSALPDRDRDDAPPRLLFSFDDQTGGDDDWSAVCGLDFAAVSAALTGAGYVGAPLVGPRDAFSGFRFRRGPIEVDIDVRAENAQRPDHLCVARMLIQALPADATDRTTDRTEADDAHA